jgi:hypothetical protein
MLGQKHFNFRICMKNKKWGFRGMKSSKASTVKRTGHDDEKILASLINVPETNIVKGTGKTDMFNKDNKRISLKSSHDVMGRSQICLYKNSSSYFKQTINGSTKRMQECLSVFPETYEEYKADKIQVKKLLQSKMVELGKYINAERKNKKEFLDFIFFTDLDNQKIDFLAIADKSHDFYIFEANDVINAFCNNTVVENSKARNSYQIPNLKVLFKGRYTSGKYVNLIENEIRTSTHYKEFLSVGNKSKYLYVLLSNIKPHKKVKEKLILCGGAVKSFNF